MKITLNITIEEDHDAPAFARWRAWEGDYDLGTKTGSGPSPFEALEDLLFHLDGKDFITPMAMNPVTPESNDA